MERSTVCHGVQGKPVYGSVNVPVSLSTTYIPAILRMAVVPANGSIYQLRSAKVLVVVLFL